VLKEGVFSELKPTAVFGMHSFGTLDAVQIRYTLGATTAALADFQITFHDKQAHAGYPQESIDPVIMAAEAVMELQTIRSRYLSPFDAGARSVTQVHAGVRTSAVPDTATLGGTIRVFNDNVGNGLSSAFAKSSKASRAALAARLRWSFEITCSQS
jgi:metal-dependent amidase/aminoacylase/carboxypeptidase family protein